MKQAQERVVLLQHLMENLGILFAELTVLKLRIGYSFASLSFLVSFSAHSVEPFRMLDHDIEPNVWLYLPQNVGMSASGDALDWRIHL